MKIDSSAWRLLMGTFGLGAAIPVVGLAYLSRATMMKVRGKLMQEGKTGKIVPGASMVGIAALILAGALAGRNLADMADHIDDALLIRCHTGSTFNGHTEIFLTDPRTVLWARLLLTREDHLEPATVIGD